MSSRVDGDDRKLGDVGIIMARVALQRQRAFAQSLQEEAAAKALEPQKDASAAPDRPGSDDSRKAKASSDSAADDEHATVPTAERDSRTDISV